MIRILPGWKSLAPVLLQLSRVFYFLTGACLPFSRIVTPQILFLFFFLATLFGLTKQSFLQLKSWAPLLLLCLAWGAVDSIQYGDLDALVLLVTLLLSALFLGTLSVSAELRHMMILGLQFAIIPAALLTLLEAFHPEYLPFLKEGDYWSEQGRISGTLQDPNSLGVFAFLASLFCLFLSAQRKWTLLPAALWFLASLYSGSRTALLGYAIFLFIVGLRRYTYLLVALSFAVVLLLAVINLMPEVIVGLPLPVSLLRFIQSLQLSQLSESLLSRSVFNKAGLFVFLHHPLFGIGPGHFADQMVAVGDYLTLGTGLWRDNSNNFYLGILSQSGLVGVLCCAYLLSHWEIYSDKKNFLLQAILISFACTLLTGPHIYFIEIFLFVLLLVALSATPRQRDWSMRLFLVLLPILAVVPLYARTIDNGWHHWEKTPEGKYFRWSRKRAFSFMKCTDGYARIYVRSLSPETLPLPVSVSVPGLRKDDFSLTPGGDKQLKYPCGTSLTLPFEVETGRYWTPVQRNASAAPDTRRLGVQVFWPRPAYSLPEEQR